MFRKKLLLRVATPFPLENAFVDLQLTLQTSSPLSSSLYAEIETLCWRISRRFRIACIAEDGKIHIVHKVSQSDAAMEALQELKDCLGAGVMVNIEEEEVRLSAFINRVIECSLRSMLLNASWRCFDDGCSFFSSFRSSEERSAVYSIQAVAQVGAYDGLVFIISPDIVKYARYKVANLIESKMLHDFQSGMEVSIDKVDILTVCSLLPSFAPGHVIGIRKSSPSVGVVHDYEQLLYYKYGLELQADHFLKVQYVDGELMKEHWFPSSMVLQGSGLMPVSQSVRASKLISVMEHFTVALEAWDFFDGGLLKVKEICQLDLGSDGCPWTKATRSFSEQHSTQPVDLRCKFSSLFMANDYRTAKPPSKSVLPSQTCESFKKIEGSRVIGLLTDCCASLSKEKTGFRPAFMGRKHSTGKTHCESINIDQEKHVLPEDAANGTCKKDKICPSNPVIVKNRHLTCGTADGIIEKVVGGTGRKNKVKKDEHLVNTKCTSSQTDNVDITSKVRDEQLVNKKGTSSRTENVDIITKVIGHYKRHQLDSLTVPQLKSFLIAKKAKVGGKKEELVTRVTAMLDLTYSLQDCSSVDL